MDKMFVILIFFMFCLVSSYTQKNPIYIIIIFTNKKQSYSKSIEHKKTVYEECKFTFIMPPVQ